MTETNSGFEMLDLSAPVRRAVQELGFVEPTNIQKQAIPAIRDGKDVIGRSRTGTGKTMAFAVPAVEMMLSREDVSGVQVLVLLPTRELAMQCCGEIKKLTRFCEGIRPVEVYGGAPMDRQILRLKRANIVVGTPGRIMDHLRRRTLKLDRVKFVVLDEADEMLSMGFKEDMETILRQTPDTRQTVLFSATMPEEILSITHEFQKDPIMIEADQQKATLENIRQTFVNVPMGRKQDCLKLLLYYYAPKLSIVFCNTKKMAEELAGVLEEEGFSVEALHGDLKQSQRTTVLDKFRNGIVSILVATDVAARGIDVSNVEYVFNYDIPQNAEYYVHRIGRTGRVGKAGTSVTICSGRRQALDLKGIADSLGCRIEEISVPSKDDIQYRMGEANLSEMEEVLKGKVPESYRRMVDLLLQNGYHLYDIAAAALSLHFASQEIRVQDITEERKPAAVSGSGEMSRILLNIGRASRVAPNHVVGALTERTSLIGAEIGKIEIFDDCSLVSVPKESLDEVLDSMIGAKICGRPVSTVFYEEKEHRRPAGGQRSGKRTGSERNRSLFSPAPKTDRRRQTKRSGRRGGKV